MFTRVPLTDDIDENETILRAAWLLLEQSENAMKLHMEKVILTALQVLVSLKDGKIKPFFKREVYAWLQNKIATNEAYSGLLSALTERMTEAERTKLNCYAS